MCINFRVDFIADKDNELYLEVFDMIGQSVYVSKENVISGSNSIGVDLFDLPAASYILSIAVDGYRINQKIVKLN